MRTHRSRCAFFGASFVTLIGLAASSTHAQLPPSSPVNYSIWKAIEPKSSSKAESSEPQVRQAFFQDGGNMPMPQIPGLANPNVANNGFGNAGEILPPGSSLVSPAAFNQFSNPGGYMQATQVQNDAGSRLRDSNATANANVNANGYAQNAYPNGSQPAVGYSGQPGYHNTAMQQQMQQTMPPGYGQPGYGQPGYGQPGNGQAVMPPTQLRDANNTPTQNVRGVQVPVVSSDPRFVMQPRQGFYSTTPYQAPFRTVAYQLPQQSPTPQAVQPPSVLPNQPQVVPQTTGLPQYQPTVGQLASYQAMQPGVNCAPGIPANGVPSYVPGAVAPPTLTPNLTPGLYTPDNSGYRPLFSLGQENYNVQLGRGIIGQPTVYVAGQPVRNFLRYLSP